MTPLGLAAALTGLLTVAVVAVVRDRHVFRGGRTRRGHVAALLAGIVLLTGGIPVYAAGVAAHTAAAHRQFLTALQSRYGVTYLAATDDGLTRLRLPDGRVATCQITGPTAAPVVHCLAGELPRTGR